jgi:hypothetical protein
MLGPYILYVRQDFYLGSPFNERYQEATTMECNIAKNRSKCNCTYEGCSKKGKCCECIRSHWSNKELPACLFPPEIEKTYDRSLAAFIEYWKDKV